jgi:flagellar hook assembly protein FlgD
MRDRPVPAGRHHWTWDANDAEGRPLPSGLYALRLRAGQRVATVKTLLVR